MPLESAATVPAPRQDAPTLRATTAAGEAPDESALQSPVDVSLPPPSADPDQAVKDALRRRAEAAEAALAELRRRERVRVEADSPAAQFPPQVTESQPPSSITKTDAVIGKVVRSVAIKLAARFGWTPLLVALGVGGTVAVVAKPSAQPEKLEAALSRIEALERQDKLRGTQVNGSLDREAIVSEFLKCLYEQQVEGFGQLLPAQDKMGSAALPKPFVDKCRARRP
jgi:hypothetical protein